MLRWRLLSASILISIAVALAWLDYKQVLGAPPGAWMMPLYLTILCLGTHEMLTMFANKGWHPVRWPVYLGVLSQALLGCTPIWFLIYYATRQWLQLGERENPIWLESIYGFVMWIGFKGYSSSGDPPIFFANTSLPTFVFIVAITEIRRFNESGKSVIQIAISLFTILYLGLLGGFFAHLRYLEGEFDKGMTALISLILIVKASDVGAYLVGRAIGRNKLAPSLSPGKTYEGAVGGLLTAGIASVLFFKYAAPQMVADWESVDPGTYMCYGILLGSVGIIGDLAESMLKREMGVKDSGNTLPGIGGMLDVLDSLLFAAPVAYVCWELGLLGR